jgi:hypothetical protein
MFNSNQEKYEYKKNLWKCILYELSKKSFEMKTAVTERCNQLMFELLSQYNEDMSPKLWEMIFSDLLKAMFDDLNIKLENNKNISADMQNIYIKNTRYMIKNLIGLINSMKQEKFIISAQILLSTIKSFSLNYPNSSVSVEMMEGMNDLSQH